ncbi:MAG: class I SAM-dependent methyltransferase [Myxococcota bacterium]
MKGFQRNYQDDAFVDHYTQNGPPAFMPGHAGVLQMMGILVRERAPADARVLVVGAGGGLETRALALAQPAFRFVGVDPAPRMLELARDVIGSELIDRVDLVEGTVEDAPRGPFDAGTCVLVLGLLADDGTKSATLREIHGRLKPGAPFVLVDQCLDRTSPDFERKLDRYAAYARASGVDAGIVEGAREQLRSNPGLVPPERNASLLAEAGFRECELFYVGMAWTGWLVSA